MKTKWQLITELGMREARARGIASRWDQLLFAARELVEEIRACELPQEEKESAWRYFKETLQLFNDEQ